MSEVTSQKYQLQMSLMGQQDTRRDKDKPHSIRYAGTMQLRFI